MDITPPAFTIQILFFLGIVNLVTLLLIYATCRCIPGSVISRITGNLMQYAAYKSFFRYHCYLWWVLWTSVIIHATLGVWLLGVSS